MSFSLSHPLLAVKLPLGVSVIVLAKSVYEYKTRIYLIDPGNLSKHDFTVGLCRRSAA